MSSTDPLKRSIPRLILGLTIPNILSNITIPLLSLIDIGLAGHMPHPEAIGSVTLAATITNTIYWLFGFIRIGTTGLVAQAYGRQDIEEINLQLGRSISIALLCSVILLFFSPFASSLSGIISGDGTTRLSLEAEQYIRILFYAAPAAMVIYALNGWYIGMQNTYVPMIASMMSLVVNFSVSYLLVVKYGLGVIGLAVGTVAAQYFQAILLGIVALIRYRELLKRFRRRYFIDTRQYRHYLLLGRDLILRSLILSSITLFFTYAGVRVGATAVAANALLMQFFTIFSYFTDGFAYAGESLSGRFLGMGRGDLLDDVIRLLFRIGMILAVMTTAAIILYPEPLLYLLSDHEDIIRYALEYRYWAALIPLVGFGAFLWDGIYVGTTRAAGLKWSMIGSSVIFFGLYYLLERHLGLTALWLAFDSYLLVRTMILYLQWKYRYREEIAREISQGVR